MPAQQQWRNQNAAAHPNWLDTCSCIAFFLQHLSAASNAAVAYVCRWMDGLERKKTEKNVKNGIFVRVFFFNKYFTVFWMENDILKSIWGVRTTNTMYTLTHIRQRLWTYKQFFQLHILYLNSWWSENAERCIGIKSRTKCGRSRRRLCYGYGAIVPYSKQFWEQFIFRLKNKEKKQKCPARFFFPNFRCSSIHVHRLLHRYFHIEIDTLPRLVAPFVLFHTWQTVQQQKNVKIPENVCFAVCSRTVNDDVRLDLFLIWDSSWSWFSTK